MQDVQDFKILTLVTPSGSIKKKVESCRYPPMDLTNWELRMKG